MARTRKVTVGYDVKLGPIEGEKQVAVSLTTPDDNSKAPKTSIGLHQKGRLKIGPYSTKGSSDGEVSIGKTKKGRHYIATSGKGNSDIALGGGSKHKKAVYGKFIANRSDSAKRSGGKMSRSEAASVAAKARWSGRSGGKSKKK